MRLGMATLQLASYIVCNTVWGARARATLVILLPAEAVDTRRLHGAAWEADA